MLVVTLQPFLKNFHYNNVNLKWLLFSLEYVNVLKTT